MKTLKKLTALLVCLCMLLSMVACGSSSASTAEASTAASGGETAGSAATDTGSAAADTSTVDVNAALNGKTIGYVTINSAAPWAGCIDTALGQIVTNAGGTYRNLDAQTETAKIAEYCQQMIDAGVDALVIFGGDPSANADIAKTADEAGIPVFMAALDVAESGRQYVKACVGPDQEEMCYEIGQYVIEQNGADAGCKVVQISGVPFLDDYIQREAGFNRAMAETNYELLEPDYAYSSRTDAKAFMENHIQTDGDSINIVMGYDDDLTMGALQAIDEAGLTGKIQVYSVTGQVEAMEAIENGTMVETVLNRGAGIAEGCIEAIETLAAGGSVDKNIETDLVYINADNVADYKDQAEF
jgi:ribose transport system substrate-binding protein